jgi:tRNA nucleotidyltransferase (CCA-adding enzyme)
MDGLRERIEALPGMPELLGALDGLPPVYVVGGAVRDLLRGAQPLDLDVAVEGDAPEAARALAGRLGGEVVEHDRFGTATVTGLPLELNLATTRRESYAAPGALPDVEPAGLAEDLGRRDFTFNAMAVGLSGPDAGVLHDPHGGRADLDAGLVRVLHDQSFIDDPTRLLRAVRYAARLGAELEPHTDDLARAAIAAGAPATVSGKRVRDELIDLLAEHEAPTALKSMRTLQLDRALHPALEADPERASSVMLAAGETGADPVLAALAVLIGGDPAALGSWLDGLALSRDERDRVARAAVSGPGLAGVLFTEMPSSELYDLLRREPPEALALALASGAPGEPVLRYIADLAGARLAVTGDDLIAAGVRPSPALGRALEETLRRKLDGQVSGRDEELALALELARGAPG